MQSWFSSLFRLFGWKWAPKRQPPVARIWTTYICRWTMEKINVAWLNWVKSGCCHFHRKRRIVISTAWLLSAASAFFFRQFSTWLACLEKSTCPHQLVQNSTNWRTIFPKNRRLTPTFDYKQDRCWKRDGDWFLANENITLFCLSCANMYINMKEGACVRRTYYFFCASDKNWVHGSLSKFDFCDVCSRYLVIFDVVLKIKIF